MQKWEYLYASGYVFVELVNGKKLNQSLRLYEFLAQVGGEGWELVSVIGEGDLRELFLKRLLKE